MVTHVHALERSRIIERMRNYRIMKTEKMKQKLSGIDTSTQIRGARAFEFNQLVLIGMQLRLYSPRCLGLPRLKFSKVLLNMLYCVTVVNGKAFLTNLCQIPCLTEISASSTLCFMKVIPSA